MLRCCTVFILLCSLLLGVFVHVGRQNSFLVGTFPFLLNEERINASTIPNLKGKIIIITGANTGLGKSTTKHLAANDATVIMGCRSMAKCQSAIDEIRSEIESEADSGTKLKLVPLTLDLGSFKSIKAFSVAFFEDFQRLDSLILNAGIMHAPFQLTEQGIESQIGVNHFGHFYLTDLLLPMLKASPRSTIVSVSSAAHFHTYPEGIKTTLEDMNDESQYDYFAAYGQSKLANVLFVQELSERLQRDKDNVFVNAVHPGGVRTELSRHYPQVVQDILHKTLTTFPNTLFFEADWASLVEVYAAVSDEIFENKVTGQYFVPIGENVSPSAHAHNKTLQKALWKISENVVKEHGIN